MTSQHYILQIDCQIHPPIVAAAAAATAFPNSENINIFIHK